MIILKKLIKNQNSNIKHCEKDYYSCYYDDVDFAIKSADEIDATTLEIYYAADCYKPEEALAYIEKYGKDNLNKNQFFNIVFIKNKADQTAGQFLFF